MFSGGRVVIWECFFGEVGFGRVLFGEGVDLEEEGGEEGVGRGSIKP